MKTKETPKQRRRRYSLHSKVKAMGLQVKARKKMVQVPHQRVEGLSDMKGYRFVRELQNMGYNIQTEIS